jgi:uncharacterized protein
MAENEPTGLVTGASSGIGEVFARRLAARGIRVILVARRRERLERLAAALPGAEALVADLTIESDLRRVEERIEAAPRLEYVVNNAGFGTLGRFIETNLEDQDRMHRLHVLAIMRLTHAALRGMARRSSGNIINVSSVAAFIQNSQNVSYGATKAWINHFTEGLYVELRGMRSPVRVQALCPGFTYSEFHDTLGISRSAIPRSLWLSAEEVVDASLRGLERNRLFVIPGWRYRLFVAALKWVPDPLKHALSIRYGDRNRRRPEPA